MEGRSRPKPQVIAGVVIVGCRRSAYRQNGALVRLEIKSGRVTLLGESGSRGYRAPISARTKTGIIIGHMSFFWEAEGVTRRSVYESTLTVCRLAEVPVPGTRA